jgi:glycine/D-amino acid oxidase-like deaminating enzyme
MRVQKRGKRCGYLFLAHSEATLARLAANVSLQKLEGVPSRIVSPDEAAELVPGLAVATICGAAWCAEHGYLRPPAGRRRGVCTRSRRAAREVPHTTQASWSSSFLSYFPQKTTWNN